MAEFQILVTYNNGTVQLPNISINLGNVNDTNNLELKIGDALNKYDKKPNDEKPNYYEEITSITCQNIKRGDNIYKLDQYSRGKIELTGNPPYVINVRVNASIPTQVGGRRRKSRKSRKSRRR